MKKVTAAIALLFMIFPLFAQTEEYKERHLLKRMIYFVDGQGKVESAEYWSIALGNFDFKVEREYPGEGVLPVEGSANLSFISSGYIEGAGYGERGKITVAADFCVEDGDSLKVLELTDIDFIFYGSTKVKLKDGAITDLYMTIEDPANKVQAKRTTMMVFKFDKSWGELQHEKDVDRVIGYSFTKEGAQRAYKAALAANE